MGGSPQKTGLRIGSLSTGTLPVFRRRPDESMIAGHDEAVSPNGQSDSPAEPRRRINCAQIRRTCTEGAIEESRHADADESGLSGRSHCRDRRGDGLLKLPYLGLGSSA